MGNMIHLGIAIDHINGYVWVTCERSNNVCKFDLNGKVLGTYNTDLRPIGITFDSRLFHSRFF